MPAFRPTCNTAAVDLPFPVPCSPPPPCSSRVPSSLRPRDPRPHPTPFLHAPCPLPPSHRYTWQPSDLDGLQGGRVLFIFATIYEPSSSYVRSWVDPPSTVGDIIAGHVCLSRYLVDATPPVIAAGALKCAWSQAQKADAGVVIGCSPYEDTNHFYFPGVSSWVPVYFTKPFSDDTSVTQVVFTSSATQTKTVSLNAQQGVKLLLNAGLSDGTIFPVTATATNEVGLTTAVTTKNIMLDSSAPLTPQSISTCTPNGLSGSRSIGQSSTTLFLNAAVGRALRICWSIWSSPPNANVRSWADPHSGYKNLRWKLQTFVPSGAISTLQGPTEFTGNYDLANPFLTVPVVDENTNVLDGRDYRVAICARNWAGVDTDWLHSPWVRKEGRSHLPPRRAPPCCPFYPAS